MLRAKKKIISLKEKQALAGYVFLAPILVGTLWLFLPAFVQALKYSVSEIKMSAGNIELVPVGFAHYKDILFVNNTAPFLVDSVRLALVEVPVILIFGFFIANLLNQNFFGRNLSRTLFFLPVITVSGVLGMLDSGEMGSLALAGSDTLDLGGLAEQVYNYEALKQMLLESDLNQTFVGIVLGAVDSLYRVVTSSGVQVLIFLAGLQSVPASLYEAAKVEGANGWICFWKISFPMVSPLIMVNFVYTIIDNFTSFRNPAMTYIRVYLYGNSRYAYATALSIVYLAVVSVILLIVFAVVNRFIVYRD